jgi:peptidyl-prolyl cis-trans isomerase SurA
MKTKIMNPVKCLLSNGVNLFLALFLISFPLGKLYAEIVEKIVALVNNEVITLSELEEALIPLSLQIKEKFKPEEQEEEMRKAGRVILENMIANRLILQEAKRQGIEVHPQRIKEGVERIKKGYGSQEEFTQALKEEGITEEGLKKRVKDELLRLKIVEKEVKEALEPGVSVKERFEEWIKSLEERAYVEIRLNDVRK